jgi:hypothetical protein
LARVLRCRAAAARRRQVAIADIAKASCRTGLRNGGRSVILRSNLPRLREYAAGAARVLVFRRQAIAALKTGRP